MRLTQQEINEGIANWNGYISDISRNWGFSFEQVPMQNPIQNIINVSTEVEGGGYIPIPEAPVFSPQIQQQTIQPTYHPTSTAIAGGAGFVGAYGTVGQSAQQGYSIVSPASGGGVVPITWVGR